MAKKKRHARSRARECAVALLYSGDITEKEAIDIALGGDYPGDDLKVTEYAEELLEGIKTHKAEIDECLRSTSENWALGRMPVVDRAILRIAVYEMLFVDEVPISVAINEAVELAKAYGGEDESSRFVNGVLGKIARSIENGQKAVDAHVAEGDDENNAGAEQVGAPE